MTVITEEIPVKGQPTHRAEFKYTRHGPVVFEDPENNVAYAVRAAWLEPGGAPYLASLRMDQARTWEEFVEACNYSTGLVPVPGDGRYEWDGYLPIKAKPSVYNPEQGYFASANNHLTPADYPHHDAIGFEWSDPYRWARAAEVLGSGRLHSIADMMALQTDYFSIPARTLVPMLRHVTPTDRDTERARELLLAWDFVLRPTSVTAGIYASFESRVRANVRDVFVPEEQRRHLGGMALTKVIGHLTGPGGEFGDDPLAGRDAVLMRSLEEAVAGLPDKLGGDMDRWQYGQPDYKHATIFHPLSRAASPEIASRAHRRTAPSRRQQLHPQQLRRRRQPDLGPVLPHHRGHGGLGPRGGREHPRSVRRPRFAILRQPLSSCGPTTASSRFSIRANGWNRSRPSAWC